VVVDDPSVGTKTTWLSTLAAPEQMPHGRIGPPLPPAMVTCAERPVVIVECPVTSPPKTCGVVPVRP
jgi:hypothetical protein